MAQVIVKMKIMPNSPEADLNEIFEKANKEVELFGGEVGKKEILPVAFGLSCLEIVFVMNESTGDVEPLEKKLSEIENVQSVETIDVRRAMG